MNHIRRDKSVTLCMALNPCHPERSLAKSEANRQTQSKDPVFACSVIGEARSFRIAVRFFDEQGAEVPHEPSREAAKECSPRRKPWVESEVLIKPRRGERTGARTPLDGMTTPSRPNTK